MAMDSDIFSPLTDFFGVPRHTGRRAAILGECPSGCGTTDDHEGGVDGGTAAPDAAAADDLEGAVGAELRHLQRREQRTHPAGLSS